MNQFLFEQETSILASLSVVGILGKTNPYHMLEQCKNAC